MDAFIGQAFSQARKERYDEPSKKAATKFLRQRCPKDWIVLSKDEIDSLTNFADCFDLALLSPNGRWYRIESQIKRTYMGKQKFPYSDLRIESRKVQDRYKKVSHFLVHAEDLKGLACIKGEVVRAAPQREEVIGGRKELFQIIDTSTPGLISWYRLDSQEVYEKWDGGFNG
jgi:hypothetical protein